MGAMGKRHFSIASLFLLVFVAGCTMTRQTTYRADIPLSAFILDQWGATRQASDIYGEYEEKFYIRFRNDGTLDYCHIDPEEPTCVNLKYELISGNHYQVEDQRTIAVWTINRDVDKLHICFGNNSNCVEFTRGYVPFNPFLEYFGILR